MTNTKKLTHYGNAKMVAHMGAKGLETENTIAAYIASGNRSFWGIETDVHVTKDKKIIATHDDNAKRVSGVDIVIEECVAVTNQHNVVTIEINLDSIVAKLFTEGLYSIGQWQSNLIDYILACVNILTRVHSIAIVVSLSLLS